MKRILFLIHDLGPGGAEKVLVNMANGFDPAEFDVTVKTLFNWGVNREFLDPRVKYESLYSRDIRGNSHWMKLWTPEQLYQKTVKGDYDIVVSFLEGPTARVAGGCPADGPKVAAWIHTPILTEVKFREGFRNTDEALRCYGRADRTVFVSNDVREAFERFCQPKNGVVLYNVYDSDGIRAKAEAVPTDPSMDADALYWCGMGKLIPLKGWDRMLTIQKCLRDEGIPSRFLILGDGPQRDELRARVEADGLTDSVTFAGYQTNPYQYLSRCALFVCASEREGFSTAAVESLICGTPVCSVNVGGMREILGENNEYGVVTENDDDALYAAVKRFLTDAAYRDEYRRKAVERADAVFSRAAAVKAVEKMLLEL